MHHLINEYRPHQARETLCLRMEEQLEKIRKETEENKRAVVQIETVLAGLADVGKKADAIVAEGGMFVTERGKKDSAEERVEKAKARDAEVWRALNLNGV